MLLGSEEGLSPKGGLVHHQSTGENSNRTHTNRRLNTLLDHKSVNSKEQEAYENHRKQEMARQLKDKQKENIES